MNLCFNSCILMLRPLKKLLELIMLFTVLSLAINIPKIFNEINTMNKVCNIMIKYAQKNGSFMTSYDQHGRIQFTPDEKLNELLDEYNLVDNVVDVRYYPGLNVPVQKKSHFQISIKPVIYIKVPFGKEIKIEGKYINKFGYSHKFYK